MQNKKIDELYNKLEVLESKRMAYLEVDNKVSTRRTEKQIEQIELEINISKYNKLSQELSIYKEVVSNYPNLQLEIKNRLIEQKII